MIVIPVKKNAKHYEVVSLRKHIYRYGYQKLQGDDAHVSACVEESITRYKESVIHQKVSDYCKMVGIPDEYDPRDYGFEAGTGEQAEA